jgi:hypothetical protein
MHHTHTQDVLQGVIVRHTYTHIHMHTQGWGGTSASMHIPIHCFRNSGCVCLRVAWHAWARTIRHASFKRAGRERKCARRLVFEQWVRFVCGWSFWKVFDFVYYVCVCACMYVCMGYVCVYVCMYACMGKLTKNTIHTRTTDILILCARICMCEYIRICMCEYIHRYNTYTPQTCTQPSQRHNIHIFYTYSSRSQTHTTHKHMLITLTHTHNTYVLTTLTCTQYTHNGCSPRLQTHTIHKHVLTTLTNTYYTQTRAHHAYKHILYTNTCSPRVHIHKTHTCSPRLQTHTIHKHVLTTLTNTQCAHNECSPCSHTQYAHTAQTS